MLEKQLRELWEMRFLRILQEEKDAHRFYGRLLKKNQELLIGFRADAVLREIAKDELKHARIARELVRIVRKKKIGMMKHETQIKKSSHKSRMPQEVRQKEEKVRHAMSMEHLKAKDIMEREVIQVPASLTISELAQLFEAKHITGAPVVDDFGKLIGVVSETDLMHLSAHHEREREETHPYFKEFEEEGLFKEDIDFDELNKPTEKTVDEIMTPWTYSAPEEASVADVAGLMIKYGVHRVIIVDANAQVKGIVTTMDIARAVAHLCGESRHEHASHRSG